MIGVLNMDGSTVAALAIGIVAALAAVVAAAVALIGLFWKVPEALAKSEQHLGEKSSALATSLTNSTEVSDV